LLTHESSGIVDNCRKLERLEIEVTRRCPLNCIHCSSRSGQGKLSNELAFKDVIRVISEFSGLGGKTVTITGGEPFVKGASFILNILKTAKCYSLSTHIYTSGYLMNANLAKKLRDSKADMVCVSIEGLETTHDKITGVPGSYRRALNTLKLLQKHKVSTRIHFTPMRINFTEFQHVVNLGETLGVRGVKIFDFSPQGRAYENRHRLELAPSKMNEFVILVRRIIGQGRINIQFGGLLGGLSDSCSVGRKIAITCEGYALPCLGLRERTEIFGNFGNVMKEPLLEIWRRIDRITRNKICLCNTLKASI
jgi:MoaA/NifB/PqqE/SkfB family radical SAM enzyme